MTSTITKAKSRHLFDTLDVDDDGVISGDDFEQAAQRLITAFGQEATQKASHLRQCYAQVWQDLANRSDTDRSGQVTQAEFEEVFASTGMGPTMQAIEPAIEAEFTLVDTDDDGVLSIGELTRMLSALGVSSDEAMEAARLLDTSGGGQISREEYLAAMREFYNSEDPSAPATRLLGKIRG